jgi:hypothetical protein
MTPSPTPLALGAESIPPGEPAQIEELLSLLRRVQEQHDRASRGTPRTVHPKQHGCVRAELIVEPELPPALRQGVFREARTFPALVRFSNSRMRDDRLSDAHGMAIKLFDVDGVKLLELEPYAPTHDFILVDHPVFFARNVADFVPLAQDFCRLMTGGPVEKACVVLKGMLSQDYRYRLIRRMTAKRPDSPLGIRYWSTTPSRFGEGAMKFSLQPQPDGAPVEPPAASADKLRHAVSRHLREREARFDFLVQLQTDPVTMPVEDPSVEWPESVSPWRKVATLRIPPQLFESAEQVKFGENLSFTPWHALPEHRPLGGINRARRRVYEVMSARRHELNGLIAREPTLREVQALWPYEP